MGRLLGLLTSLSVYVIVAWPTAHAACGAAMDRGNPSVANELADITLNDRTPPMGMNGKRAALLVNRGWIHLQKGDYEKAIAAYSEAIRLDPKNAKAFCGRALCWRDSPRKHDADFAEALRLDPVAASVVLIDYMEHRNQKTKKLIEDLEKEIELKR